MIILPCVHPQVVDTHTLLVHEDPVKLEGLRALDMESGQLVWTVAKPLRPSLSCGSTVLTSSDLVVACQCGPRPSSDDGNVEVDGDIRNRVELDTGRRHSNEKASGGEPPGPLETSSVCMYSIKPGSGKMQWEAEILAGPSSLEEGEGDGLPVGALSHGQKPIVLADTLVVLMRHSVVSVQRRPSLLPGPDGRKGGEVIWVLRLPRSSIASARARLELHGGLLLLTTSPDDDIDAEEENAAGVGQGRQMENDLGSGDNQTRRIMLVINPSNGQVGEIRQT